MASVTRFVTTRLKLRVNATKSAVDQPSRRKFLGFSFTPGKAGLFGSAYEWFVRVGLAAKGPAGRLSC